MLRQPSYAAIRGQGPVWSAARGEPPPFVVKSMPSVTVTLHGTLQHSLPSGEKVALASVQAPTTVSELLQGLGLPVEIVSMLYLNGEKVSMDASVKPGDLLEVFPLLCGG